MSHELKIVPLTNVFLLEEFLHYQQIRIHRNSSPIDLQKKHFNSLINSLNIFMHIDFVHGDVVRKNIIFDGEKYNLIDLEPCLYQIKNGRNKIMFTPPYISASDYSNKILTFETDKIGFFYFVLRERKILNSKLVQKMFQIRMIENQTILPIPEKEFCSLAYEEILNFAWQIDKIDWL